MKKKSISRRRFVALSCLGTAGTSFALHLSSSTSWATNFIRERVIEGKCEIAPPRYHPSPGKWNDNAVTATWIGHSTVLVNFYGLNILTDPVMFTRCGLNVGVGTIGPKRIVAPALSVDELPPIDLLLMSHAHMDHFDVRTLSHFSSGTQVVTASSTADLFSNTSLNQISELRWGEGTTLKTKKGKIHLEAFQVKHWGARWRNDTHRGYNGYVLEREGRKIIFGGDTAYTRSFAALKSRGPFELAIMPIGAYQPWIVSHCTPEEAVAMANDAGAKYILPIHHQTFRLGRERRSEPSERFQIALDKEQERIALREIGETFTVG